jgi:hypothetical protein
MAEAIALLIRDFTDEQWRGFIRSAWAARMDYTKYRDLLKRATELNGKIADGVETLAKLIRQFADTGVNVPNEFYSIPALLEETDNYDDLLMWRSMRPHILGDPPRDDVPEAGPAEESNEPPTVKIVVQGVGPVDKVEIDPEEASRNGLRYAWGTAPDFPALLDTVAKAARRFKPSATGMIGAAIESQKKNASIEYLRAFKNHLTDVYGLELTLPIMQAMAIVANIVINQSEVDVTYDDVRHALGKPKQKRQEDF